MKTKADLVSQMPEEGMKIGDFQNLLRDNNFPVITREEFEILVVRIVSYYGNYLTEDVSDIEREIRVIEVKQLIRKLEENGNWSVDRINKVLPTAFSESYFMLVQLLLPRLKALVGDEIIGLNRIPAPLPSSTGHALVLSLLRELGVLVGSNSELTNSLDPILSKSSEQIRQAFSKVKNKVEVHDEVLSFIEDVLIPEIEKSKSYYTK